MKVPQPEPRRGQSQIDWMRRRPHVVVAAVVAVAMLAALSPASARGLNPIALSKSASLAERCIDGQPSAADGEFTRVRNGKSDKKRKSDKSRADRICSLGGPDRVRVEDASAPDEDIDEIEDGLLECEDGEESCELDAGEFELAAGSPSSPPLLTTIVGSTTVLSPSSSAPESTPTSQSPVTTSVSTVGGPGTVATTAETTAVPTTPLTTAVSTTAQTTAAPTTPVPTTPVTTATPTTPVTTAPAAGSGECLPRARTEVLSGLYTDRLTMSSPASDLTIDARGGVSHTSGVRALEVGESRLATGLCVLGWSVFGQQSEQLSWRVMHDDIGGSALRVYGSDYVVDGLRARNVEDGFDPRGGENFEVRNVWMEYIRDDCIENDERRAGVVRDSLFDGCYTFFSEQEAGDVAGESLIFEHVLVRMVPMPAPHGETDTSILGHGSFFKKFDKGGRHEPVIRDSVFFLEEDCHNGCKDWPAGTVADNVTLVWAGDGEFPMSVLPGMTLTTDRGVWDAAVADWKQRHGCTTIERSCSRLHEPLPYN